MSEPYLGQVALFSFPFAPKGYALCKGQSLQVAQNQALFSLLGTSYGGDGQTNFNLPNLQGAVVVGNTTVGVTGGEANHTLAAGEIPPHLHSLLADGTTAASSNTDAPAGKVLGQSLASVSGPPPTTADMNMYSSSGPNGSQLASAAIGPAGSQPHDNMMPSLGLNYYIALQGIYPSRS